MFDVGEIVIAVLDVLVNTTAVYKDKRYKIKALRDDPAFPLRIETLSGTEIYDWFSLECFKKCKHESVFTLDAIER